MLVQIYYNIIPKNLLFRKVLEGFCLSDSQKLFYGDAFGQISWHIRVILAKHCKVISQKLDWDDIYK
jgi:hypothetical protein